MFIFCSLLFEVDVSVLMPVLNLSKLVPQATSEKTELSGKGHFKTLQ